MTLRDVLNRDVSDEGITIRLIAPHSMSHLFFNNYLSPSHYWLLQCNIT